MIAIWVSLALVTMAGLVTVTICWRHDAWVNSDAEGNVETVQAIVLGLGFLGVVAGAVFTYRCQEAMKDELKEDRRKYQFELDKFTQEQAKCAHDPSSRDPTPAAGTLVHDQCRWHRLVGRSWTCATRGW